MGAEPERLRADVQELARVLRSGMTGVYSWNGVKTMVGRKLDALDALLAKVERLAGERDELLSAMKSVHVGNLMDALAASEAECERLAGERAVLKGEVAMLEAAAGILKERNERLAGRVAELMDTLEIIETSPTVEDANRVARSARSEVLRADVGGSE